MVSGNMKKSICHLLICTLVLCTLCACSQASEDKQNGQQSKRYEFTSQIEKESCYLCSENAESSLAEFGRHANVGIVNVNTFEVMELEINRYDWDGNQIMEATGAMHMCGSTLGDIRVSGMVNPDGSYSSVNFNPEGETIDEEKLGLFLCQDCLDEFASSCYGSENIPPIAVVSFEHRYLAALNERTPWFSRKDYLVTVNYDEDGSIGVVAIYNPPRFQDNEGIAD